MRMLNLDQLSAFMTAAEKGSFSAAARHLGKSQGAISISINNLELDLGMTLFDRSGKYPVMTEQGIRLFDQAKVLLRQAERIQNYAKQANMAVEDSLTIVIEELIPVELIETTLEKVAQRYPLTVINLLRASGAEFEQLVSEGTALFGVCLVTDAVPRNMDFASIGNIEWSFICSPDFPLADLESVSIDDMLNERQIACKAMLEHPFWSSQGKISQEIWCAQYQHDLLHMVEQGIGWATVPSLLLEHKIESGTLKEFNPVFQTNSTAFLVDLMWRANERLGPVAQFLRSSLQQEFSLK
ncbi:hypothetical protein A3K86_18115 [Photobacterium jeanii]|uniref:HTH lysR-type domain-containing protein n=1 Tax=Photobacterium jeanii TaxID=858640 RepID=A0A178K1T2_9GAMM|nr:LysR family transcriptional regulator [Photobacterium jeanii]OAN10905.1 hypothetical protein A3K86_18115 [Photobacterium jeanii]PST90420.1 LysR family transcriptional regulator [Photobacterium jeanii]